jgi:head-tail adaptor
MTAGELRERVTFQRLTEGAGDGKGNYQTSWSNLDLLVRIPAAVKPVRATEVVLARGIEGRVLYEVKVRHTAAAAGIRVGDRMVDVRSSVTFNVKSPPTNPDMRNKYITLLAETGGADG